MYSHGFCPKIDLVTGLAMSHSLKNEVHFVYFIFFYVEMEMRQIFLGTQTTNKNVNIKLQKYRYKTSACFRSTLAHLKVNILIS